MKYKVNFTYTIAKAKGPAVNMKRMAGEVRVTAETEVDRKSPEVREQFARTVYDDLQSKLRPGEFLIANKFEVTKIAPLV